MNRNHKSPSSTVVNMRYLGCKHPPKLMFTHEGVSIYAASKMDLIDYNKFDIIFNLTGYSTTGLGKSLVTGQDKWLVLNSYIDVGNTEEVLIDWYDGHALPVSKGFWETAWKLVIESGAEDICFCCFGGHGRTGTAIAILRTLLLAETPDVAIHTVRSKICSEAIETVAQENYVWKIATGKGRPDGLLLKGRERPKPVIMYICEACGKSSVRTINITNHKFCTDCIKLAATNCEVHGDGRVKAIRDSLIQRAKKTSTEATVDSNTPEEDEAAEGIADTKSIKDKKRGSLTCDVCLEETIVLRAITVEAEGSTIEPAKLEDVMVCQLCYNVYTDLLTREITSCSTSVE